MRSPESFDAFYASSRDRLLHETYALTGDIAASRTAVRDAFAVAWHHWRKVAVLDDQEIWLRPVAHGRAKRRANARPWHRDKDLPTEVQETLEALGKLTGSQRHLLVLLTLSDLSPRQISRVVGVAPTEAERQLQVAVERFCEERGVDESRIHPLLDALAAPVSGVRWPRAPIVRRAGTARRRVHTAGGAALAAATVFLTGTLVAGGAGAQATGLHVDKTTAPITVTSPEQEGTPTGSPAQEDLEADQLLARPQVVRLAPAMAWRDGATGSGADAVQLPCQREESADPESTGIVARSWNARPRGNKQGGARLHAHQVVARSADPDAAAAAFAVNQSWYAGCSDERTQLVSTHAVRGIGDQAARFRLHSWGGNDRDIDITLVRTGSLLVTTVLTSRGAKVEGGAEVLTMAAAVNRLCGSPDAGACAGRASDREVAPLSIGTPPGLLSIVDLPAVDAAKGSWVGLETERLRGNNRAATRCDNTTFGEQGITRPLTRTFLMPEDPQWPLFGLSQVVATAKPAAGRDLVRQVRNRVGECGSANLGTRVEPLASRETPKQSLHAWALNVEVDDNRSQTYLMAILRNNNVVSQVGFTPDGDLRISNQDFVALVERAMQRSANLRAFNG